MNLRELEETLHTLESRHPGLNEVMLVTLLRAGGWEEKNIEEARLLFRSTPPLASKGLPPIQEAPVFEPVADERHMLTSSSSENEQGAAQQTAVIEPVSLVERDVRTVREELPHNLPLRPFEASEHVWPFSRYRDVFYGAEVESNIPVADKSPVPVAQVELQPSTRLPVMKERPSVDLPQMASEKASQQEKVVIVKKTGDENLVIVASVMLVTILLLLGYMYSNGRL